LERVLPDKEDFDYTIRLVSEVLESNGSSSMGTVCSGTLAMMDGGVPIKAPVSGIAMGLVKEGDQVVILSDILGDEDHTGDMDFKVTGTEEGITALQMDIKIHELSRDIMEKALEQAKAGRLHILNKMLEALSVPRGDISPFAPENYLHQDQSGQNPGHYRPRRQSYPCHPKRDQHQDRNRRYGLVKIAATTAEDGEAARLEVETLTMEPEVGPFTKGKWSKPPISVLLSRSFRVQMVLFTSASLPTSGSARLPMSSKRAKC
jgi:polyribonucleotide nucleotidyltransferase